MNVTMIGVSLVVGLFLAMVALLELGRWLAKRRPAPVEADAKTGMAVLEGAVFGLMGLLLAFIFTGALARWDTRRGHIRDEVNSIGTAYLRLDLLPTSAETNEIRQMFRDYVDARLVVYSDLDDPTALHPARSRADEIRGRIWKAALAQCRAADSPQVLPLVVNSLNEMFDMSTTRDLTAMAHPPVIVFVMLGVVVFTSSLLAGYDMAGSKRVSRVHMVGYALMISLTVYVTLEIEFPRLGLIRIDAADQAFFNLRAEMK